MANPPDIPSNRLLRKDLELFLPTPRLIKQFDQLAQAVAVDLPDSIAGLPDNENNILASGSFIQSPQTIQTPEDASSRILAGQIFGA